MTRKPKSPLVLLRSHLTLDGKVIREEWQCPQCRGKGWAHNACLSCSLCLGHGIITTPNMDVYLLTRKLRKIQMTVKKSMLDTMFDSVESALDGIESVASSMPEPEPDCDDCAYEPPCDAPYHNPSCSVAIWERSQARLETDAFKKHHSLNQPIPKVRVIDTTGTESPRTPAALSTPGIAIPSGGKSPTLEAPSHKPHETRFRVRMMTRSQTGGGVVIGGMLDGEKVRLVVDEESYELLKDLIQEMVP